MKHVITRGYRQPRYHLLSIWGIIIQQKIRGSIGFVVHTNPSRYTWRGTWWRQDIENFCITGPLLRESTGSYKGPGMWRFNVFLDVGLNKLLNKESRCPDYRRHGPRVTSLLILEAMLWISLFGIQLLPIHSWPPAKNIFYLRHNLATFVWRIYFHVPCEMLNVLAWWDRTILWFNSIMRNLVSCINLALPGHWQKHAIFILATNDMMTSSNGNFSRVTGLLWGEFTGHRWIPLTTASDAELCCLQRATRGHTWIWS